ncbi:hypothetical protein KVQ82_00185 [Pseudomonas sp. AO-1]|nr:hypothetical protein KVQ82_00185 [Pseudomonas sp. AO-1]
MSASFNAIAVSSKMRAFASNKASFLSAKVSNTQMTFRVSASALRSAVWVSQIKPLISPFAVSHASVSLVSTGVLSAPVRVSLVALRVPLETMEGRL